MEHRSRRHNCIRTGRRRRTDRLPDRLAQNVTEKLSRQRSVGGAGILRASAGWKADPPRVNRHREHFLEKGESMPLTADRDLEFFASFESLDLPVDDNVVIYRGAFVGRNRTTGYVRPLIAGDEFVGVAYRKADNTVAGHVAGGITVR